MFMNKVIYDIFRTQNDFLNLFLFRIKTKEVSYYAFRCRPGTKESYLVVLYINR